MENNDTEFAVCDWSAREDRDTGAADELARLFSEEEDEQSPDSLENIENYLKFRYFPGLDFRVRIEIPEDMDPSDYLHGVHKAKQAIREAEFNSYRRRMPEMLEEVARALAEVPTQNAQPTDPILPCHESTPAIS